MSERRANEATIEWPMEVALPAPGSTLDAGVLGKAFVTGVETPFREVYRNYSDQFMGRPFAVVYHSPKVTVAILGPIQIPPPPPDA